MSSKIKKLLPVPLKRATKHYSYKVVDSLLHILEPMTGTFFSFQTRPMRAASIWIDEREAHRDYSDYAIVMQGPIKRNNFTLESLKTYKKYFNNALIILSTWEGEDADTIAGARAIGVEVILNKMPELPKFMHVNMQLTTSRAGLMRAIAMKKKYALKTRTDQRIYHIRSLTFMTNLLKNFPYTVSNSAQKGRLIALGAYDLASKPKPYHMYDNLIFGYTEDVLLYFGADFISDKPVIEFLKESYPDCPFTVETYFFSEFLKKVGHTPTFTPEDHERSLATHCILLDPRSLGWYWYKYFRSTHDQNMSVTYRNRMQIGFVEWLSLYNSHSQEAGSPCC